MVITLESSIIHILNTAEDYPVLSEQPLLLEPTAKEYLIKTLEKTLSSDDVKNCFFRSESCLRLPKYRKRSVCHHA